MSLTKEKFSIEEIYDPKGSIYGGYEIRLSGKGIQANKHNLVVHIFETSADGSIIWGHVVSELKFQFTKITFLAPEYYGKSIDKTNPEIICYIKLVNITDKSQSNSVKYIYMNENANGYSVKYTELIPCHAQIEKKRKTITNLREEYISKLRKIVNNSSEEEIFDQIENLNIGK